MSVLQELVAGIGIPNFKVLIPEIIILITAFIVFVIELLTRARFLITVVTAVGLILAAIPTLTMEEGDITFYGLYAVDTFSLTFKFFLILSTFFVVIVLRPYLESKKTYYGEYYYLILFILYRY